MYLWLGNGSITHGVPWFNLSPGWPSDLLVYVSFEPTQCWGCFSCSIFSCRVYCCVTCFTAWQTTKERNKQTETEWFTAFVNNQTVVVVIDLSINRPRYWPLPATPNLQTNRSTYQSLRDLMLRLCIPHMAAIHVWPSSHLGNELTQCWILSMGVSLTPPSADTYMYMYMYVIMNLMLHVLHTGTYSVLMSQSHSDRSVTMVG